jgi:hypothetical protein
LDRTERHQDRLGVFFFFRYHAGLRLHLGTLEDWTGVVRWLSFALGLQVLWLAIRHPHSERTDGPWILVLALMSLHSALEARTKRLAGQGTGREMHSERCGFFLCFVFGLLTLGCML